MALSYTLLLLAFLVIVFWPGYASGFLFLFIALHIFMSACFPLVNFIQYLVLASMMLAIPASGYLAGALLNQFAHAKIQGRGFCLLGMALALALIFESDSLIAYLEAALSILQHDSSPKLVIYFISIVSSTIFCGAIVAFAIMLLQIIFELIINWFQGSTKLGFWVALKGLRPLSVLLILTLSFNLIAGLFAQELWPTVILALG